MPYRSKGKGFDWTLEDLCPENQATIEDGVRIFHPEHVSIGPGVYVGHDAILSGHPRGHLAIGAGTWIGPRCLIYSQHDITIGEKVGIGPHVQILTDHHDIHARSYHGIPIIERPLVGLPIKIDRGSDIGAGSIVLAGAWVQEFAQVGAHSVVNRAVRAGEIWAGVPVYKIGEVGL